MPKRKPRSEIRKKRGVPSRKVNTREKRKIFLIVCEGEKTEPFYFRSFRVPINVLCKIEGVGRNTVSLVNSAIKMSRKDDYDQTWVVMDKDQFPNEHFNKAVKLAKANDIRIAHSNEAFEIWYLLHFDYYDSPIPRSDYSEKLSKKLGFNYEKNNSQMVSFLIDKTEVANRNAKELIESYAHDYSPARSNPSTTVHLLVEELRKQEV